MVPRPTPQPDPAAEDGRERWGNWIILLLGLALSIGSKPLEDTIAERVDQTYQKLVHVLGYGFEHLGVVLVVAWLVRVAIERASERQFLRVVTANMRQQISTSIKGVAAESLRPLQESIGKLDDVLGYTIRREGLLDDESQKVLKERVLSPKFIRTEYALRLTLEPFSADLVNVRSRSIYSVKNVTKAPAKYTVEAWVDTMFEPAGLGRNGESRFTRFNSGPEDSWSEVELRPFVIDDMISQGKIYRNNGGVWLRYELHDELPPEATYKVDLEGSQLMRSTDLFVWTMNGLTRRFTVSVEFAKGYTDADFDLEARELHHIGRDAFRQTFRNEEGVHSWSINQVLLPYQGVEIWWSPHSKLAVPAPAPATTVTAPGKQPTTGPLPPGANI